MYLIYNSEVGSFQTLRKEGDDWVLRPSTREALWAPIINSKEELQETGVRLPPGFPVMEGAYRKVGLAVEPVEGAGKFLPSYMFFERVTDGYPHYTFLEHTPPDRAQWLMAWALARAFGHAWGVLLEKKDLEVALAVAETARELEVRVYSALREEVGPLGGIFPRGVLLAGRYVLPHTTATGRVYWEVRPGGELEVVVSRPPHPVQGGDAPSVVLRARYARGRWEIVTLGHKALPRHVTALIQVAEGASAPMPDELVVQMQGAALRNEEAQARENLARLAERFGNLIMGHLRRLIANGEVSFGLEGDIDISPSAESELGRDFVGALKAAYRDTPVIASLLMGKGGEDEPQAGRGI
jgi:hypothetical protein